MTIQEFQRLLAEERFKPFRILTADGRAYSVLHPKFLAQSPTGRLIAIGLADDSFVTLDLLLVVGAQKGTKSGKNGSKRRP